MVNFGFIYSYTSQHTTRNPNRSSTLQDRNGAHQKATLLWMTKHHFFLESAYRGVHIPIIFFGHNLTTPASRNTSTAFCLFLFWLTCRPSYIPSTNPTTCPNTHTHTHTHTHTNVHLRLTNFRPMSNEMEVRRSHRAGHTLDAQKRHLCSRT